MKHNKNFTLMMERITMMMKMKFVDGLMYQQHEKYV